MPLTFWTRFAINTALSAVVTLLQGASTSEAHKQKLAAFVAAGQDLLASW